MFIYHFIIGFEGLILDSVIETEYISIFHYIYQWDLTKDP